MAAFMNFESICGRYHQDNWPDYCLCARLLDPLLRREPGPRVRIQRKNCKYVKRQPGNERGQWRTHSHSRYVVQCDPVSQSELSMVKIRTPYCAFRSSVLHAQTVAC